ncbi:hypothetical protein JCM11641_001656 [Rhodosporidiobolus odoratus]
MIVRADYGWQLIEGDEVNVAAGTAPKAFQLTPPLDCDFVRLALHQTHQSTSTHGLHQHATRHIQRRDASRRVGRLLTSFPSPLRSLNLGLIAITADYEVYDVGPRVGSTSDSIPLGHALHGGTRLSFCFPKRLSFVLPLYLQCLLLHPIFPASLSRPLRFLLMPFTLTLAFSSSYRFALEPRHQAVGINLIVGVLGGNAIWKGLEWGLAQDLTPYAWVGLDGKEKEWETVEQNHSTRVDSLSDGRGQGGKNGASVPPPSREEEKRRYRDQRKREHSRLLSLRAAQARQEGVVQIFRSSFHLLTAMRGQGYQFCDTSTQPFPDAPGPFFRRLCLQIAWSHPLLLTSTAMLVQPATSRDSLILSLLPASLSSYRTAHLIGEVLAGLATPLVFFSGFTLGFSMTALLLFVPNVVLRKILPPGLRPPRFEPKEYPPLFDFAKVPSSVAVFWGKQWHSFLARPFHFLAFDPVSRRFAPIVGKLAARTLGVIAVFALSSWIHEFGLSAAISTLQFTPNPIPANLPFSIRWGGSIYFMSQGIAIILESAFATITKKRVGGMLGALWTLFFTIGMGSFLYNSWTTHGLVRDVPPVSDWNWKRFVIPMSCVLPPPFGTKV